MKTFLIFLFSFLFLSSQINAQDEQLTQMTSPIIGNNNGFGYGNGAAINLQHFLEDPGVSYLFFHKGFNNFGLTVGTLIFDYTNPELIFLTPEYRIDAGESSLISIQLKSVFPDDFSDIVINPTVYYTYGSPQKHLSLGYGMLYGNGEFETMALFDGFYANASLKLNGRYQVIDALTLITRNEFVFSSGINSYFNSIGVDFSISDGFDAIGMVSFGSLSTDFGSGTDTAFSLGLSYKMN